MSDVLIIPLTVAIAGGVFLAIRLHTHFATLMTQGNRKSGGGALITCGFLHLGLTGYLRRIEHSGLRQLKLPPEPFGAAPFTVMVSTGKGGRRPKPYLALYPPGILQELPAVVMSLDFGSRPFHQFAPDSLATIHGQIRHHAVLTVVNPNHGDVAAGRACFGDRAMVLLHQAV